MGSCWKINYATPYFTTRGQYEYEKECCYGFYNQCQAKYFDFIVPSSFFHKSCLKSVKRYRFAFQCLYKRLHNANHLKRLIAGTYRLDVFFPDIYNPICMYAEVHIARTHVLNYEARAIQLYVYFKPRCAPWLLKKKKRKKEKRKLAQLHSTGQVSLISYHWCSTLSQRIHWFYEMQWVSNVGGVQTVMRDNDHWVVNNVKA